MRRMERVTRRKDALRIRGDVVDFDRVVPRAGDDRVTTTGGQRRTGENA